MPESDFAEWERSVVGFLTRVFVVFCCLDSVLSDEERQELDVLFRWGTSLLTLAGLDALRESVKTECDRLSANGSDEAALRLTRVFGQISTRANMLRDRTSPLHIGERCAQVSNSLRYLLVPRRSAGS